jgi:hypothetical protein
VAWGEQKAQDALKEHLSFACLTSPHTLGIFPSPRNMAQMEISLCRCIPVTELHREGTQKARTDEETRPEEQISLGLSAVWASLLLALLPATPWRFT